MKLTRLLFLFLLNLLLSQFVFTQDDTRVTATWQVQKYDIAVTLPASETDRTLVSKASVTVKNVTSQPATTLSLRISPGAEVTAVSVGGATADFTKREEKVGVGGSLQRLMLLEATHTP